MQNKKFICYFVGSIALFAVACLVIPKITKTITNKAYKKSVEKKTMTSVWPVAGRIRREKVVQFIS